MGSWSLHEGDCLPWLASLSDKSVDVVITDPPYEAEAHTAQRRIKTARQRSGAGGDDRVTELAPLPFPPMTEAERVAVGAQIARLARRWGLVFCQVEGAMLWRKSLEPLTYRRTCVWVKPDGQPQLSGDRPGMGYESIVCVHPKGRSRWNGGGRVGVFTHNTLTGARAAWNAKEHPAQKPLALMLELVSLFSEPGETVLDPYAGSGTTGVACLRLGRRFLGAERDHAFAQTARERLAAEERGADPSRRPRGATLADWGRPMTPRLPPEVAAWLRLQVKRHDNGRPPYRSVTSMRRHTKFRHETLCDVADWLERREVLTLPRIGKCRQWSQMALDWPKARALLGGAS